MLAAPHGQVNLNCYRAQLEPLAYLRWGGFGGTSLGGRLVFWRFAPDWEGCCGFSVRYPIGSRSISCGGSPGAGET